jgi:hypothetical protein
MPSSECYRPKHTHSQHFSAFVCISMVSPCVAGFLRAVSHSSGASCAVYILYSSSNVARIVAMWRWVRVCVLRLPRQCLLKLYSSEFWHCLSDRWVSIFRRKMLPLSSRIKFSNELGYIGRLQGRRSRSQKSGGGRNSIRANGKSERHYKGCTTVFITAYTTEIILNLHTSATKMEAVYSSEVSACISLQDYMVAQHRRPECGRLRSLSEHAKPSYM